jgi:D-cysteine desulfhydrase
MNRFIALCLTLGSATQSYACEPSKVKTIFGNNIEMKHNPEWIEQLNQAIAQEDPALKKKLEDNCAALPLAKQFPALRIPHISLCTLPTPVQKLENLSKELGATVFIKRDDMTGGQSYGGNKPRKLALELARALSHRANTVITFGCAGSNHAVATSEHARNLGLEPICMLKPQANSQVVRKNLLLHLANGTELHYAPNNDVRKVLTISTWVDVVNKGLRPYIIPTGGSTPLGTVGFVNAACELKEQIDAGLIPMPDYVYVPCGSCATTVGLTLGFKALNLPIKVIAIAVEPEEEQQEFKTTITKLFKATNELLNKVTNGTFPILQLKSEDIEINLNFTGPEYAVFTQEGIVARELLKKTEAITIDGTYTCKAFAALLADIKSKKSENKTVLFWNTYCGTEFQNRVATVNYKDLPACFHAYFEEDVQELDRVS